MQTSFGSTMMDVRTSYRLARKIQKGLTKEVEGFKTQQSFKVDGEEPATVFINRSLLGRNGLAVSTEAEKLEHGKLHSAVKGAVDFLLEKGIIEPKHAAKIMRNFNQDLSAGTVYVNPQLPVQELRHSGTQTHINWDLPSYKTVKHTL
jgi:hypothetical protein